MNIEVLRDAVDKLTQRLVTLEHDYNDMKHRYWQVRKELESMRAWNDSAFREVTKWATGHL